jgi:hypothetical protein
MFFSVVKGAELKSFGAICSISVFSLQVDSDTSSWKESSAFYWQRLGNSGQRSRKSEAFFSTLLRVAASSLVVLSMVESFGSTSLSGFWKALSSFSTLAYI